MFGDFNLFYRFFPVLQFFVHTYQIKMRLGVVWVDQEYLLIVFSRFLNLLVVPVFQSDFKKNFSVIRFHCYACDPDSNVNWRTTPLFLSPYRDEIKTAAREFNVDPALVRAVIHAESAFNDKALSPKGAQGLMQLMPATAEELGVRNAMVAPENIRGGVNYLARMLKRFDGDIKLATAAYNAGPGAVGRHGGIPPYAETRAYVERVGILHQRYASN